jgi:hypothetical protein
MPCRNRTGFLSENVGAPGGRARNLAVIPDKIDVNYRYMAISIKPGRDSASARHKPLFAILPWSRDFLFH